MPPTTLDPSSCWRVLGLSGNHIDDFIPCFGRPQIDTLQRLAQAGKMQMAVAESGRYNASRKVDNLGRVIRVNFHGVTISDGQDASIAHSDSLSDIHFGIEPGAVALGHSAARSASQRSSHLIE